MAKQSSEIPVKIIDISDKAWLGGMSLQTFLPIGGVFGDASNFDPFNLIGVFQPSTTPGRYGINTVSIAGMYNVGFSTGGVSYFYSFGNGTKVFQIKTSDGYVTDVSNQISDVAVVQGATSFQSKIIYSSNTSIKANAIPLSLSSQVGLLSVTTAYAHILKVGPDRQLYVTNGPNIGRITSVTGTAGNNAQHLAFESDVVTRDIESVGNHLVILGDTNSTSGGSAGRFRCFVAFWNMKSNDLTQIWEFEDNITYSLKFTGEEIIVFARDNIYTCTIDSPIRPLVPMRDNSTISSGTIYPSTTVRAKGQVIWGSTTRIYGYGRPTNDYNKILSHKWLAPNGNITSLFFDGSNMWMMTDSNRLYSTLGSGGTTTSNLVLSDLDFTTPYIFAFARIVLLGPLQSGESIILDIGSLDSNKLIADDMTMSFAIDGAILTKNLFISSPAGGGAIVFKNGVRVSLAVTGNPAIRSLEIFGIPMDSTIRFGY